MTTSTKTKMSKRDLLLSATNRRYKIVPTPIGSFTIRSLTETERSEQELSTMNRKTGALAVAKLPDAKLAMITAMVVDDDAKEVLFTEADWPNLRKVDSSVIASLYSACLAFVGFDDQDIDELVGNSD